MQIHVLASGSTGNSVFFQMGKTKILVDAGISTRRIERGLAEVGVRVGDIDGVLITHEHTDHIKGLDVLIRKYQLPVYTRAKTWNMIKCREKFFPECRIEIENGFTVGEVEIESFNISHDAVDPVGFCFHHRKRKCVLATDFGVVTDEVKKALAYANAVVLESNHDLEMLNNGPYPAFLKQRIRSKSGHLSNCDAARLICGLPRNNKLMHIFLAHLSQKNNVPGLAERTVRSILLKNSCPVDEEIILHRTYPDRTSSYIA